mgnify:CR=1 FL=1
MSFGFDFGFGFDVYALWEKKRPVLSCIFIFILFGFWIMILEQAALTHDIERIFRSKKLFKTTKAPSSTWLHRHHKQPGHLWGWTDPPPPQGRTYTTAEQLGRVRRVKVRPGEGVIALPYEPSWGPKALAFTSTQAPSGVDMSAQYDEQQQPGMYPWATTQNLRRNYTSLILAAL